METPRFFIISLRALFDILESSKTLAAKPRAPPTRMSRLLITLMTGLLGAGATVAQARPLKASDPNWMPIMAQARTAAVKDLPAGAKLTMNRVWLDGSQAQVCGVSADANGNPVVVGGRMQLKRVQLRKQSQGWLVEKTERVSMKPHDRMDSACGLAPAPASTDLAQAIQEMEKHPPAAGVIQPPKIAKPVTITAATTSNVIPAVTPACASTEPKELSRSQTGAGVVTQKGRSLLHSSPDLSCYIGKFIVGGDKITILSRSAGWAKVSYTHPVTQVTTVGWLKDDRIALKDSVAASGR